MGSIPTSKHNMNNAPTVHNSQQDSCRNYSNFIFYSGLSTLFEDFFAYFQFKSYPMKLFLSPCSLVCTLLLIFNNFSGLCVADDSELHITTEETVISDGHQPTIITVELLTIEEITKLPVKSCDNKHGIQ